MTYTQQVLAATETFLASIDEIVKEEISRQENRLSLLEKSVADLLDHKAEQDEKSDDGRFMNMTQTANVLGVSRPTVYRLVESGALPAKKLSTGSDTAARTVVLTEDLKAFLDGLPSANP